MKVLTATVLAWLLRQVGRLIFCAFTITERWCWSIRDWAGIAPAIDNTDRSLFGWTVGEAVGGYVDTHEYKAGGTSSDD